MMTAEQIVEAVQGHARFACWGCGRPATHEIRGRLVCATCPDRIVDHWKLREFEEIQPYNPPEGKAA
jgi:hypothetical protein